MRKHFPDCIDEAAVESSSIANVQLGTSDLYSLDPASTHDVGVKESCRLITATIVKKIEYLEMLGGLPWKTASIDRNLVFYQTPESIDPLDGLKEKLVLRAGHKRLVEIIIRLEYVGP